MEDVRREQDSANQSLRSEQTALETTIQEQQRDIDRKLNDMERRLSALEKSKPQPKKQQNVLNQVTVLVGIVCVTWIVVTLMKLFS